VPAGPQRRQRLAHVEIVRRGDVDDLDRIVGEELVE
jgi:hypothetical protein